MSRPVVIGITSIAALGLPKGVEVAKTGPGIHSVSWQGHGLTVWDTGIVQGGKKWFVGTGSKRILVGLAHLGADVRLWASLTAAQKAAVFATGIKAIKRKSDGKVVGIHPPVVFAGDDPITVGLDGKRVEGESYYVEAV